MNCVGSLRLYLVFSLMYFMNLKCFKMLLLRLEFVVGLKHQMHIARLCVCYYVCLCRTQ